LYKDRDTTKRPFVRSRAQPDFLEWLRCRRGALFDPPSDEAFRKALRRSLDKSVKLIEVGGNINDEAVAAAMVESLLGMVKPVHSQAI
jgi:uncharacterized protein (UPF0261 family)